MTCAGCRAYITRGHERGKAWSAVCFSPNRPGYFVYMIGWLELGFSLLDLGSYFDYTLPTDMTYKNYLTFLSLYVLICKMGILGTILWD